MKPAQHEAPQVVLNGPFLPAPFVPWLDTAHPQGPAIVDHLLWRGERRCFAGKLKSGKAWYVAALAAAVSSGRPFFGLRTEVTQVLFINLRLREDICRHRFCTLLLALNMDAVPSDLRIWNLHGNSMSLVQIAVCIYAQGLKPGLIIIDPLYKILGRGRKNNPEDRADLMRMLDDIACRFDAAIVYTETEDERLTA